MSYRTHPLFCKAFVSLLLAFCQVANADIHDMSRIFHSSPTISSFEICHSGGCADISSVSISDDEWQQVSAVFVNNAQTAAEERTQIAQAIGVLENLVGNKIALRAIWLARLVIRITKASLIAMMRRLTRPPTCAYLNLMALCRCTRLKTHVRETSFLRAGRTVLR